MLAGGGANPGLGHNGSGGHPNRASSPAQRSGNPFDFEEDQPAPSQPFPSFTDSAEPAQRGQQGETLENGCSLKNSRLKIGGRGCVHVDSKVLS